MPASDLRLDELQGKAGCDCRVEIHDSEHGNVIIRHEGTVPIIIRPKGDWVTKAIQQLQKAHERVQSRNMAREAHLLGDD